MAKRDPHRGDILHLNIEIECFEPTVSGTRQVRLLIGGMPVFDEYVLDTDPSGKRTNEWARYEALKVFGGRLMNL